MNNPHLALTNMSQYMFTHMATFRKKVPSGVKIDPSGGRVETYKDDIETRICHREDATPQNVPDLEVVGEKVTVVLYFLPPDPLTKVGDIIEMAPTETGFIEKVTVVRQRFEGLLPCGLFRVDGTSRG